MVLHPVVTGTPSLDKRSVPATNGQDFRAKTFRNRTTIGSSFKSSFSIAGTSMEYTRNTDFTSAVCTEICHKSISLFAVTTTAGQSVLPDYIGMRRLTFAFLITLHLEPIHVTRMNFSRCDSLSFEYVTRT